MTAESESGAGSPAPGGAAAAPAAKAPSAAAASGAPAGGAVTELDPRVADVLQRLRSGVRLRQAEAATLGGLMAAGESGPAAISQSLLAVKSNEYVQEPVAFSHRPRLGKLIVFSRKAFFHLFLKWFIRPVLAEQNAFNQAAGRMLQELAEAQERAAREARLLGARLTELEARAETVARAAIAAAVAAESRSRAAGAAAVPATGLAAPRADATAAKPSPSSPPGPRPGVKGDPPA